MRLEREKLEKDMSAGTVINDRVTNPIQIVNTPIYDNSRRKNLVKSPSDTTIYTPVLNKTPVKQVVWGGKPDHISDEKVDTISDFVKKEQVS